MSKLTGLYKMLHLKYLRHAPGIGIKYKKLTNINSVYAYNSKQVLYSALSRLKYATVTEGKVAGYDEPVQKSNDLHKLTDFTGVFDYRKTSELIRALIVFKLCSYGILVRNSDKVRLFLSNTEAIMLDM